jgi:long-chain acyl-CoA synthetase
VDRLRELVIVSGFNVYPTEVEDVICEVEGVDEAAVIGAPHPQTGETVVAYVTRASASGDSADELADRVREYCATRLARFKQPTEVHVVDALPHTVTGKVAKGQLRAGRRRHDLGLLQ